MSKKVTYEECLTDWVLQYADDKNPNHSQFSAAEVAHLIQEYQRQKLNGNIKKGTQK